MKLEILRFSDNGESTSGLIFVDDKFECYSIEDEFRVEKVNGETRIPEGIYGLEFRKENSPLTKRYQDKYPFFSWHLQLQDVPNFKHVYIHIGNTAKDSDGCIIVGDSVNNNTIAEGFVSSSKPAFERLYTKISKELEKGNKVTIEIKQIYK
jgi:hypothetical protein